MEGNNTLVFNQATMVAALQTYLKTLFKEGLVPHVIAVHQKARETSGYGNSSEEYEIVVEEKANG